MSREIKKNVHSAPDALVFLNTPISDASEDILGFQAHVRSLRTAIDSGSQMIAVTSPFGAGKSSIAELLKKDYEGCNKKVINVSMWSHLCNHGDSTIELHRNFLYQLVSHLCPKNGSYISRRLSKSYGLLRLHTSRTRDWLLTLMSLVLFVLGYIFPYVFKIGLPTICGDANIWNNMLILGSIVCIGIVILSAEIVFSSNKSEGERTIDANELIELYHRFVLKPCQKAKQQHIIIIEDLDRTDNNECVIDFLKELRKYYIQNNQSTKHISPDVVFLVNVKPETALFQNSARHKQTENESLYAKLFDFILNVQTINIDDYETILESILQKHKDFILLHLNYRCDKMADIPGMQWIIHGKHFGIRDIKDRLNKAFTIFESLRIRFPSSPISFEKCAVVAYLTTAFEKDFLATDDKAFGQLVEANIQNALSDENCKNLLSGCSLEYINTIKDLLSAKLIDSNYRMYFYNYPKNSSILSHDEIAVQNAILYDEDADGLAGMAERVAHNNPTIIKKAFEKVKALKLPMPNVVFMHEPLYIEALRNFPTGVYDWIKNLDYSQSAFDKTSKQLMDIIGFDKDRRIYSSAHAEQLCRILETKFSESQLLRFRTLLCSTVPEEICAYSILFGGVHDLISMTELRYLSLSDSIALINTEKDSFGIAYVIYIQQRLEQLGRPNDAEAKVESFFTSCIKYIAKTDLAPVLLQFMVFSDQINVEFEELVMDVLHSPRVTEKQKQDIRAKYRALINQLATYDLSTQTLENIHLLEQFDGYSNNVASLLYRNEYVFDAAMILLSNGTAVDFENQNILESVKDSMNWLLDNLDHFTSLRLAVVKSRNADTLFKYTFLFAENCPVITLDEFAEIKHFLSEVQILELVPPSSVTTTEANLLLTHLTRKFLPNSLAFKILMYVSKFQTNVVQQCFYSINFDTSIKYQSFAAVRKNLIKSAYGQKLNLASAAERIRFMNATRFLDSAWEDEILSSIKINSALQKSYIEAVNNSHPNSITGTTIKCICSLGTIYALNDSVTEKLFHWKKHTTYVISRALYKHKFVLDEPDRKEALWQTYLEIFSSTSYPETRKLMALNNDFLKEIMTRKDYCELPGESRMVLAKIPQDADCIHEVMKRGDDFSAKYLTTIQGFTDESAATTFVELVEKSTKLLRSQALYDHTHDKLVSSSLKAKYTRARKKLVPSKA